MGLITTHCCTKNESSDTPPDMKLKIQLQGDISNNLSSSLLDNRKRVSFSETMEQRNTYIENEKRYTETKYDDIKKNPFNEEENIEDNLFTNVSFEESDNKFVIEDNFHRQRSMLPKTYEEIDKIINGDLAYKSIDKNLKPLSYISSTISKSSYISLSFGVAAFPRSVISFIFALTTSLPFIINSASKAFALIEK